MSIIHFSHANGFPANSYSVLFDHLKQHKISFINILGEYKESSDLGWHGLADDIIEKVKEYDEPVIGVGHSLGGVLTMLAAAKEPKYFKSVILLDPPLFSPMKRSLVQILRKLKLEDMVSPAKKSKTRRDKFASKVNALQYFKKKSLFKNIHPQSLKDYVEYGLKECEKGVELSIPVAKEIAIFRSMLIEFPETVYKINGTLIHAADHPILWNSDINWIKKSFSGLSMIPYPGSHLFPLETPDSLAKMIERVLN